MNAPVIVLVIGVLGTLALLVGVLAVLSRTARKSEADARREFPDAHRIDTGALFFGQESRGATQMRGNGTLVFAPSEVVFKQWVVGREFRVPYRSIESLETPRAFLGKSQGVKLLKINFTNDSGEKDAMAWRVRDLDATVRVLEERMQS